jgi:hypothetical protein
LQKQIERSNQPAHHVELVLSYEQFVKAHDLTPLVSIKRALETANIRNSRFYELVNEGTFRIIKNGSRSNVSAMNLYEYYVSLVSGSNEKAA